MAAFLGFNRSRRRARAFFPAARPLQFVRSLARGSSDLAVQNAPNKPGASAVKEAEREASRRHWLHRADLSLSAAQEMAEGEQFTDPGTIATYLKSVLDAAGKADCLTEDDMEGLSFRAIYIERIGYERFMDHLLELMRTNIRGNKKAELPPLITAFNDVMGHLRRLGLDDEGFERLKAKLVILLETAAPGGQQPKASDKPIKLGNFQGDHRLYVRYVFPPLVVVIGRARYRTADWSLGGLLVAGIEKRPAAEGELITIKLGLENGKAFEEQATVVKYWEKKGQMAVRFRRFGSCMVAIKREAELRGQEPKTFDQLEKDKADAAAEQQPPPQQQP